MKNVCVKKVETKREMNDFVKFAGQLYDNCQYYVPDLDMDIMNSFNPSKNAGLEYSEIQPFIAYNATGNRLTRYFLGVALLQDHPGKLWRKQKIIIFVQWKQVTNYSYPKAY